MMVAGETQFQLGGFVLVLGAAASSGLRWSLTQILLRQEGSTHNNPLHTILSLSPIMALILFVLSMMVEGPLEIGKAALWQEQGLTRGIAMLVFPGFLAFSMTLSEFLLLNRTSVLTLAIAGICKEVVTILVACVVYGDVLDLMNSAGLVITTICIAAYNYDRYMKAPRGPTRGLGGV